MFKVIYNVPSLGNSQLKSPFVLVKLPLSPATAVIILLEYNCEFSTMTFASAPMIDLIRPTLAFSWAVSKLF